MDKKQNRGNKLKLRETHLILEENNDRTLKCNTHSNTLSIRQNPMRITNITSKPNT